MVSRKARGNKPCTVPWPEIRIAVVSGAMSFEKASAAYGVPFGTISARSSREGWFKRDGRLAKLAPELSKEMEAKWAANEEAERKLVATSDALSLPERREKIRNSASKLVQKGLDHALGQPGEYAVNKAANIKSLVDAGAKAAGFDTEDKSSANLLVSINFLRDLDPAAEI